MRHYAFFDAAMPPGCCRRHTRYFATRSRRDARCHAARHVARDARVAYASALRDMLPRFIMRAQLPHACYARYAEKEVHCLSLR